MSTRTMPIQAIEFVPESSSDFDDDTWHFVCHCTNDNIAACGLDVTDEPWVDRGDEEACPLCWLSWPDGSYCPWGCTCEDCLV